MCGGIAGFSSIHGYIYSTYIDGIGSPKAVSGSIVHTDTPGAMGIAGAGGLRKLVGRVHVIPPKTIPAPGVIGVSSS